jgi:glycerol-3-phosphate dehydrogenase
MPDSCKRAIGGRIDDFKHSCGRQFGAPRGRRSVIEHLAYTYGSSILPGTKHKKADLAEELIRDACPVAEVLHAIHHEMACSLADVIQRRTELGATGLPPISTLQKCTDLMRSELGWSMERQQQEINSVAQAYPFKQIERVVA